jgi:predicted GIY-YIG superfamily endonuclease
MGPEQRMKRWRREWTIDLIEGGNPDRRDSCDLLS